MEDFLQGYMLGLAYVAPIGVQNIFVINSANSNPFRRAIAYAMIVAFFDISLAIACFYGIGEIMRLFGWLQWVIVLFGAAFLIFIGQKLLRSRPCHASGENSQQAIREVIATACVVTWLNPQALLDGTIILGAFRSSLAPSGFYPFMGGVCAASLTWFPVLAAGVNLFRSKLGFRFFRCVNVICGCVILCYGLKLLLDFSENILGRAIW